MKKETNYRVNPSKMTPSYVHLIKLKEGILQKLIKYSAKNAKSTLLDFGCGDMPYKELLSKHVSKYVGADLNLNPSADVHFDFNSKTNLSDEYADLILSSQVLEHVDDVESYLNESYRLLKNNGYMILSTHGYWIYHPTPGDYWRWTASGLQKTIEKHGYEIVEFTGIMGLMATGLQLFQFGLVSKFKNKYLVGATNYFFQRLVMLFDKFSSDKERQIDASLYILVAQKKIR